MYTNLLLLLGLMDTGHLVGISDTSQHYFLTHEVQEFKNESYTTNAAEVRAFAFDGSAAYLALGLKLGVEQHYKSKDFDRVYAVTLPTITVGTKRPDINFFVSIEGGKGFWSLTKDRIGKDIKGYNEQTGAIFVISINADKFLNDKGKKHD